MIGVSEDLQLLLQTLLASVPNADADRGGSRPSTASMKPISGSLWRLTDESVLPGANHVEQWMSRDVAETYIRALHRQYCWTLKAVSDLGREELQELGIAIGHRPLLTSTAKRLQENRPLQRSGNTSSPTTFSPSSFRLPLNGESFSGGILRPDSPTSRKVVAWHSLTGTHRSLEMFLGELEQIRARYMFPQSFGRLFFDNAPMPFVERVVGNDSVAALLVRVPDLKDSGGTSVTTISNRVCFLISRQRNVVVTYHRCDIDLFAQVNDEWNDGMKQAKQDSSGDNNSTREGSRGTVAHLLDMLLKCVVHTYQTAAEDLRDVVDYAEATDADGNYLHQEVDDTMRVQILSVVAKKAEVYRRCSAASKEAMGGLLDLEWLGPSGLQSVSDSLASIASNCDEIANNARGSMDAIIAMTEFRSSSNLQAFTYITIFMQPITVATSWYGMNWDVMPELSEPNGYYTFICCALTAAVSLITWFIVGKKIRSSVHYILANLRFYLCCNNDESNNPVLLSELKAGRVRHVRNSEEAKSGLDEKMLPLGQPLRSMGLSADCFDNDEDDVHELVESSSPAGVGGSDDVSGGQFKSLVHRFSHRVRCT